MKSPPTQSTTVHDDGAEGPVRLFANILLLSLLVILALRLTMTESLYDNYQQVSAQYEARLHPPGGILAPEIGPAVTLGLSALTGLLVTATAVLAAIAGALSVQRMGRFVLIAAILGLAFCSTLHASNRFTALVGLSDIGMSLLGAWTIGLLCHRKLLGSSARRIIIAMLLAMLAVWTAKAFYQRFIEIPDTIEYYNQHKKEALAAQGMSVDDPGVKLYESRMNSKEVTGYVTLSNVVGAGMIGLLSVLAGLLAAKILSSAENAAPVLVPAPAKKKPTDSNPSALEIPITTLFLTLAYVLLPLGLIALFLTQSRGGSGIAPVCIVMLFAGAFLWKRILIHRHGIVVAAILVWILGTAAILAFGITQDRLPGKSLTFRWHYWSASAPLIERAPLVGVGLNNFGDYYASVKRASSPETVRHPHSFFIRLAAETGIPATLLVAALILWQFLSATRIAGDNEGVLSPAATTRLHLLGIFFCAVWWIAHQLLAESAETYSVILTTFAAIIAAGTWSLAITLLSTLHSRGLRFLSIALLVGALGMLAYDQINMALVTGPVAMLFWVMLSVADSHDGGASAFAKPIGMLIGAVLFAGTLAIAFFAWIPALSETMPWDPRPFIERYIAAVTTPPPNLVAAKAALGEAIARNPRNIALYRQMMQLKDQLHEPIDEEVKTILSLDHTDFRLRVRMAIEPSSLGAEERVQLLNEAIRLNAQLPADEIMRLSSDEERQIESALGQFQASSVPATGR